MNNGDLCTRFLPTLRFSGAEGVMYKEDSFVKMEHQCERERGTKIFYSTLHHLPPALRSDSTVSEDAEIALLRLWHWQSDALLTIRLNLNHIRLELLHLYNITCIRTISPAVVETSVSSSLWRSPKRSLWGDGPEPVCVNLLT